MTAHTPGPWQAFQWSSGNWHITPLGTDRPVIVTTEYQARHGIDALTEQANARLIAAAPDLLAACEAIDDAWAQGGDVYMSQAVDVVLLAITKAKSETS